MEFVIPFAIALAAGLLVGLLSGLLGIGGGAIMVPLFRLGLSLDPIVATATSLFCIFPTACSGLAAHVRNKTCLPRIGIAMGLGGALLSPVGVWLATKSPTIIVMAAAAVIILYSSVTMVRKALDADRELERADIDVLDATAEEKGSSASECGADSFEPEPAFSCKLALESAGIGAIAGLCSGYVGVGGGFIMIPMMVSLLGIPMRKASGTSLIAIAILALPGVVEQIALGNVDLLVGIAVVCGSIPGALLGANFVKRFSEKNLRLFFAGVLAIAAVALVVNEFIV